jgi:hypothetical protein
VQKKRGQKVNFKRRKRIKSLFLFVLAMCSIAIIIYSFVQKNNIELYGRWQSLETGATVQFYKDGTVVLKPSGKTATFQLLKAHTMHYNIEDKTFEMIYYLDGKQLKWGLDANHLEVFTRKY